MLWNSMELVCPTDNCRYNPEEFLVLEELPKLASLLTTSAEALSEDNPIWEEIKVFSNVQAKFKRTLHCDKSLHLLQRVGTCLRKMVLLNLSKAYLDLAENVMNGVHGEGEIKLLPARQQLEFVLCRTQGAAKLICEALHYSRETFCSLVQRIKIGHIILHLMMAASVTARVNILFKGFLVQMLDFYPEMHAFLPKLKKSKYKWPEPLNLPDDLEVWLKPEHSDLLKPHSRNQQQNILETFFSQQTNGGHSNNTNFVTDAENSDNDCTIIEKYVPLKEPSPTECDYGEIISRDSCEDKALNKLTESQLLLLEKIQNATTLKKLNAIWSSIEVNNPQLLPQVPSLGTIRSIRKMLLQAKKKIQNTKNETTDPEERKKKSMMVIKLTALKFADRLGLKSPKRKRKRSSNGAGEMDMEAIRNMQVSSMKDLKQMYEAIYQVLQSQQQHEKCQKLKKIFKRRSSEFKLLRSNGEKGFAKKLVVSASQSFIKKFC